jgi:HD-GYP domain-containing protein (c-di-GMP phosphodiesterase class II)
MADGRLSLAELLAALSLATDLGNGFSYEKTLRTTLLATRLGELAGLAAAELSDTWYTSILRFTGCTAYAHEMGRVFGDEIATKHTFALVDPGFPKDAMRGVAKGVGKDEGPLRRARHIVHDMRAGMKMHPLMAAADCEAVGRYCRRLAVSHGVASAVVCMFERWDGKGAPRKLSGEAIPMPMRLHHVAHVAEVHLSIGGRAAATAMIKRGRGGWFDPAITDLFLENSGDLLAEIEIGSVFETAVAAEPATRLTIGAVQLDDLARTFADFVDLKSPYTLTHSSGVARLAEAAGITAGLAEKDVENLRRAALLHDLGRASVPNGIWDKPGPLSPAERERVRLHAYHSERVLAASPLLASLAPIAGMHHERLDGSGYHRGNSAAGLTMPARILAAADVFHALMEERPHRPAFAPEEATKEIEMMVSGGLLDARAVSAVCAVAGQRVSARRDWPARLTDREIDVLRLIARGATKKQVGAALFISPATAHTHIVHIYEKIGAATRAGAALFAMENDLLEG